MKAVKLESQDFEIFAGNDKTLNFTLLDESDAKVDLTGATIRWGMAKHSGAKTLLFSYTSPTNITIPAQTGDNLGLFSVAVQPADTSGLKTADYYHECEIVDAASNILTGAFGTAHLKNAVL